MWLSRSFALPGRWMAVVKRNLKTRTHNVNMLVETSLETETPQVLPVSVAAVIVNYGTAELVVQCLDSLQETRNECDHLQVYVVDNASSDNSVEEIQAAISERGWSEWVELMCAPSNGGFAFGNNVGIRRALAGDDPSMGAVWLLNSDTIVRRGALESLLQALETHPQAGIVGSRLEDRDGTSQRSAFRFQTIGREWARGPVQVDQEYETDWLAGASMLIRREVIDDTGLLDEGYFLYYEEVDYCLRAARQNWRTVYVPTSRVVHLVGQSSGVTSRDADHRRLPKYWYESRARFFTQNYGKMSRILADISWLTGHLLYRGRCFLQRKSITFPKYMVRDFVRFNFWWPSRVG